MPVSMIGHDFPFTAQAQRCDSLSATPSIVWVLSVAVLFNVPADDALFANRQLQEQSWIGTARLAVLR